MSFVSLCPMVTPVVQNPADHLAHTLTPLRAPAQLAYSYAIPGEPHAATVARTSMHNALSVHGLTDLLPPALQATGELVACAALFEPGKMLYLSVGWDEERPGIRIVLWDPHVHHADPENSAQCATRRNKMLYLLACVVHECKGRWGVIRPAPAREGTRVWVNLPREGAASYAAALC
ncbi:ATP-binding protein [Streptomyces triculaminicus]|uniref:ATP-binding protein n=1 Tax=Streptomyces triculaminicus TaxID=2816232 RepID=UPI003404B5C9